MMPCNKTRNKISGNELIYNHLITNTNWLIYYTKLKSHLLSL